MGPDGMGPMTGRGAGYCAGSGMPGYMNAAGGRGLGAGFGRRGGWGGSFGAGRGRRLGFFSTGLPGFARFGANAPVGGQNPDPETTRQFLKSQADSLQSELEAVKQRLSELEQETSSE